MSKRAELDQAAPVSLHWDAPLTAQYFIEDHPLIHAYRHLASIRAAISTNTHHSGLSFPRSRTQGRDDAHPAGFLPQHQERGETVARLYEVDTLSAPTS